MKNKRLLIIFIIQFFPLLVYAGNTGKLAGKITDSKTGEALFGINVVVESSKQGAATDAEGSYIVNNIEPGVYSIAVSGIGYQKKRFTNVKISSDFTTRLDVQLAEETISLESVVVVAEAPLVRKDLTSTQTVLDGSTIKALPVESVDQVLSLQAGVVKGTDGALHIRGGRANEVDYTINGVSVQNPLDNSRTIKIATNAIQELSVVSGTFNAEYGNALSGVVNTVTKEGGSDYHGFLSFHSGDYVTAATNIFYNIDKTDVLNNAVIEGTVSGPIPETDRAVTFFLSGRYNNDKGYLYGIREHTIYDSLTKNPTRISSTGDGKVVAMNPSVDFNATAKLTYKPISTIKINYDAVYSRSKSQSYDHYLKYDPDANPTTREYSLLNSIEMRHAPNASTFYSVKGSYNFYDYKRYLYPLVDASGNEIDYYPGLGTENYYADNRYQPDYKIGTPLSQYDFAPGGTRNAHSYQRTKTLEVKFDLTSQLNTNHELKFGAQYKSHNLSYESFSVLKDTTSHSTPTILASETISHDLYKRKPYQFSAYVQDKMEFQTIILNVGLRYDYLDSKAAYAPLTKQPDTLLVFADGKQTLSPRIGMSFPITDKGIIHFSYGHFYQSPPFSYLYTNPLFLSSGVATFGNANLKSEKTVTYEMGLQQQLTEDIAFNVTGFYKDVRDLLALQYIRVDNSTIYYKYVNKDYGNIKGITFSLTKRRTAGSMLGATLDYTYQVAEGNDVNADAFFLDVSSGRQTEKVPVPLAWDQPHTLNATISLGNNADWNVAVIGRLGSGLPYTPQRTDINVYLRSNSERRPSQLTVDLLAEKSIKVSDYLFTVFLKIFNLFDTRNERLVYLDTGRGSYTIESSKTTAKDADKVAAVTPGGHRVADFYNRPNYYDPPREVRFGMSFEF